MKTKTINVYKFDELNKEVKEKVLDRFRENSVMDEWYESNLEGIREELIEKVDINIKDIFFEVLSRENNIHILSSELISELCIKYNSIEDIDLPEKFGLYANYLGGGMSGNLNESEFNEEFIDIEREHENENDIEYDIENEKIKEVKNKIVDDLYLTQNILKKGYKDLQSHYEYLQSDEYIEEFIECNEYNFDESGAVV